MHHNQTDNFNAMIVEPAMACQPNRNVKEMGPLIARTIAITWHHEPLANSLTCGGLARLSPKT